MNPWMSPRNHMVTCDPFKWFFGFFHVSNFSEIFSLVRPFAVGCIIELCLDTHWAMFGFRQMSKQMIFVNLDIQQFVIMIWCWIIGNALQHRPLNHPFPLLHLKARVPPGCCSNSCQTWNKGSRKPKDWDIVFGSVRIQRITFNIISEVAFC